MTLKQTQIGSLVNRALLVDLDIHFWHPFGRDRQISDEVHDKYNTDGSYNKRLLPKKEFTDLNAARTNITNIHKAYTLAWGKNERIIGSEEIIEYQDKMRKAIDQMDKAADEFAKKYGSLVAAQEKKEKGSFKGDKYPTKETIRSRYGATLRWSAIPQGNDVRLKLSDQVLSVIKSSIDEDQQSRIEVAVRDIAERIRKVLGNMVTKLNEYDPGSDDDRAKKTFKDSLVTNVKELADELPRVNIIGDARIDKMADEIKAMIAEVTPYHLRHEEKTRLATAKAAQKILDKVGDFI